MNKKINTLKQNEYCLKTSIQYLEGVLKTDRAKLKKVQQQIEKLEKEAK